MATALTDHNGDHTDNRNCGLFRFDLNEESMSALGLSCSRVDEWIAADIHNWSECLMRYSYQFYSYHDEDPQSVVEARRKLRVLRAREVYLQARLLNKKAVVVWPVEDEPKSFAIVGNTTLRSTANGESVSYGYRYAFGYGGTMSFFEFRPCFTRTLQACASHSRITIVPHSHPERVACACSHVDRHWILRRQVDDQEVCSEGTDATGRAGVAGWSDRRAGAQHATAP